MLLPGFTADVAVGQATRHYAGRAMWGAGNAGKVVPALAVGGGGASRSCSSKDGEMDCFCTGGCCRTKHSCTCCGGQITADTLGGVFAQ